MTQMLDPAPHIIQPKPVVGVGIVIVRQGAEGPEVVLIRRGRAPLAGHWSIPGGRQEYGETVRATALREAKEETGLTVGNPRLIDVIDGINPEVHWTLIDFRVDWVSGEIAAGDDAADAVWVPMNKLSDYKLWDETVRVILAGVAMS